MVHFIRYDSAGNRIVSVVPDPPTSTPLPSPRYDLLILGLLAITLLVLGVLMWRPLEGRPERSHHGSALPLPDRGPHQHLPVGLRQNDPPRQ